VIFSNPSGFKKNLFHIGTGGIIIAIIYFIYLYQPLAYSWLNYEGNSKNKPQVNVETPVVVKNTENNTFDIQIPKIGAQSKIVAGVSPYNKDEYLKVLGENLIAQSKTSSLPGSGKGTATYLFAHSSQQGIQMVRNNSVFYLLGEMKNDDEVFVNYKGKIYTYKVYMKKIVGSKEVGYIDYTDKDKEIIILQTCWPIGTNWQRLLIFAERI
jgi:LPXTG-site transpeptidase (sortase) family protein